MKEEVKPLFKSSQHEIIYKHHPHYTASTFTRDDIQHVETIVYNMDSDSLYGDDTDGESDIETVMILNVCMDSKNAQQTKESLEFASKAMVAF